MPAPEPPRRTLLRAAALAGTGALAAGCAPVARQVGRAAGSGGTLVMAQTGEPSFLTLRQQNTPNVSWPRLVFNTLTAYDHRTLRPQPQLARDWQLSDGGRTVEMRLRRGVRFHSGRPFGPKDVAANLAYQASAKGAPGQLRTAAAAVEDCTVRGPDRITIRLAHRISNFFDLCEIMLIFDHESIPELESGKTLNGTGAFRVTDYDPGVALRMARNPHYWRPGRPRLDAVELRIISQAQAITASLQAGQTHLGFGLAPANQRDIRADDRLRLTVQSTRDSGMYLGCNTTKAPLDDKRVRQAIAWAIDRDKVRDMAMAGNGAPTSIPWSPSSPAYDAKAAGHYHRDPDRARSLLHAAGAHGAHLELTINSTDQGARSIAEIAQDGLRAVGLDTAINPLQPAEFQQRLNTAAFPALWVGGHGFGQLTPATLLNGAYPFNAGKNASNYADPRYRALARAAWTATDTDAARRTYRDVTALLLDEQFVIDLVGSSGTFAATRALHGVRYTMFNLLDLDDATLDGS